VNEPSRHDVTQHKSGASSIVYTFIAIVVVTVAAMFFWQPWKGSPPAAPLRYATAAPNAHSTSTAVPTP